MKYKVKKEGSFGKISPIPVEVLMDVLNENMTYEKKNSIFIPNYNWRFVKLYRDKTGKFPIGLLQLVEKIFKRMNTEFEIINSGKIMEIRKEFYNDLRPYQEKIVNEILTSPYRCIMSASVGAGKTRMSKEITQTLKCKTLITVPSIEIKNQWISEFRDISKSFGLCIYTYQKIMAMLKKDAKATKAWLKTFELYISDECHIASIDSIYKISQLVENAKVIGLSGTPFRCDGNTQKMNAFLGYSIKNFVRLADLIRWGYLVDFDIEEYEIKGIDTEYKKYPDIYNEQVTHNSDRNNIIFDLANKNEKPVIVFVDKLDHGENLMDLFPHDKAIFFNGTLKKKDRKREFENIVRGKYDVVISTKVLNEGVNINNLKTLIFAGSGRSSVRTVQQLGRVLRLDEGKEKAKVIHFHDKCKYLTEHYQDRVKILNWEKYGNK